MHIIFTLSSQLKHHFPRVNFFDLSTAYQSSEKRTRSNQEGPYLVCVESGVENWEVFPLPLTPASSDTVLLFVLVCEKLSDSFQFLETAKLFPSSGPPYAIPSDWSTLLFCFPNSQLLCKSQFNVTDSPGNSPVPQSQVCSPNLGFSSR